MCELTAKGLRGPAQLGGDRASPRGEWASFPYVAGAGSRMGRSCLVLLTLSLGYNFNQEIKSDGKAGGGAVAVDDEEESEGTVAT